MSDESKNHARSVEQTEILAIMRLESGRSFMYRMIQATGLYDDVFSTDPYTHAYRAGKRATGTWLMNELKDAAPDMVLQMIKENYDG